MTARELAEWIAYFESIEPIPDAARDAALIRLTIAQVNGNKDVKFDDLMPRPPREDKPGQAPDRMKAILGRTTED